MCKKLCIATGAVIVGLLVITFTGLGTLAQVKWNDASRWMEKQVPPETQLKQLQVESDKIDKDIKKNLGKLAAQEVEYERLEKNVTAMKDQQITLKAEVAAMDKALNDQKEKVSYNGKTYRPSELALRLESKVNELERQKTVIKTHEQVLASKRQSLELAHERIQEMREQKKNIQLTIAKLEARIEALKLKQVDCPIEVDGSQVNKCNVLADKLDRQLSEEEHKTALLKRYFPESEKSASVREEKTIDEVRQAAKKALQDDDAEKVVDNK